MHEYARAKGFHPQTLERWNRWEGDDRSALADLAVTLKASENHIRDLMDWLEEISLRDGAPIREILSRKEIVGFSTHPRLGRGDKLKRIKEQLRRWRFPRLASVEDALAASIEALRLPSKIRLNTRQGLEGGQLSVIFEAGTASELGELSGRLREAAASEAMARVFAILAGKSIDAESERG